MLQIIHSIEFRTTTFQTFLEDIFERMFWSEVLKVQIIYMLLKSSSKHKWKLSGPRSGWYEVEEKKKKINRYLLTSGWETQNPDPENQKHKD